MGVDVVGDIHGHADQLEALLQRLGYAERRGAWRHPDRTAIFVGDLIDRGPGQLRTLKLVRAMLDAGSAEAVMGNHELNAIGWATAHPERDGDHLRSRHGAKGEKNRKQHQAFLAEVDCDSAEHRAWIDWFLELPLWIERLRYRVVHACWSLAAVAVVRPQLRGSERLEPETLRKVFDRADPLGKAIEVLLKGPEVEMPQGWTFTDKDRHVRREIRTRWWAPELRTFRSAYIGPDAVDIPDLPLPGAEVDSPPDRPTFIGHYWLNPQEAAKPLAPKVACVDYSVAKGGPLVAYRFDGEPVLSAEGFVAV